VKHGNSTDSSMHSAHANKSAVYIQGGT